VNGSRNATNRVTLGCLFLLFVTVLTGCSSIDSHYPPDGVIDLADMKKIAQDVLCMQLPEVRSSTMQYWISAVYPVRKTGMIYLLRTLKRVIEQEPYRIIQYETQCNVLDTRTGTLSLPMWQRVGGEYHSSAISPDGTRLVVVSITRPLKARGCSSTVAKIDIQPLPYVVSIDHLTPTRFPSIKNDISYGLDYMVISPDLAYVAWMLFSFDSPHSYACVVPIGAGADTESEGFAIKLPCHTPRGFISSSGKVHLLFPQQERDTLHILYETNSLFGDNKLFLSSYDTTTGERTKSKQDIGKIGEGYCNKYNVSFPNSFVLLSSEFGVIIRRKAQGTGWESKPFKKMMEAESCWLWRDSSTLVLNGNRYFWWPHPYRVLIYDRRTSPDRFLCLDIVDPSKHAKRFFGMDCRDLCGKSLIAVNGRQLYLLTPKGSILTYDLGEMIKPAQPGLHETAKQEQTPIEK